MKRCKRSLGRIILFSFALRALVPLGLMLQLPAAFAQADVGAGQSLGFVICPIQNPNIDLTVLVDAGQANGHHHHHKSNDHDDQTISVDRGASLCNLWSSSTDSFLNAAIFAISVSDLDSQPQLAPPTSDYQSNNFPRRLTRAPPQTL